MLTAISDIHLSDESTSKNVSPEAYKILQNEIASNAKDKNANEIRFILLGDIIDLMRTEYWQKVPDSERPWNGTIDLDTGMNNNLSAVEGHFNKLLDDIMGSDSGKAFIGMLDSLKNPIPAVPVKITYVIGNHDRAFHNFESLKNNLKNRFQNIDEFKFQNQFDDEQYAVLCRHGHEWDENNYGFELYKELQEETGNPQGYVYKFDEKISKVMTIGEVITAELMSSLIYRANEKGADKSFIELLKDLNNVRPMSDAFIWLYWHASKLTMKNKRILLESFKESLNYVINCPFSKKWDEITKEFWLFSGDITDRFEQLFSFIEDKNFDQIAKYVDIYRFIDSKLPASTDDLYKGAKREFEMDAYKKVQYILYGHTHEARHDYFYGDTGGKVKLYINIGTYLPYIQQAEDSCGFAAAHQMTMAFIYNTDEDRQNGDRNVYPTLDLWNGIKRKVYK